MRARKGISASIKCFSPLHLQNLRSWQKQTCTNCVGKCRRVQIWRDEQAPTAQQIWTAIVSCSTHVREGVPRHVRPPILHLLPHDGSTGPCHGRPCPRSIWCPRSFLIVSIAPPSGHYVDIRGRRLRAVDRDRRYRPDWSAREPKRTKAS